VTTRDPRPDARETLLLRAALADGDAARAAWRAWRADADLDRVDQASFRLLPLVFRNLERLAVDDPWRGRLQGFYRRAWCENQILFRRLAATLDGLARDGVPALVLKGAALASQAYADAGARPMSDADVLVRRRDFEPAVAALRRGGWTADPVRAPLYDRSPREFRERHHAMGFRGDGDVLPSLDLHDRPLQVYARHPVDFPEERLWEDAETFPLGGTTARRLSPEHALAHACFHGFQRQDVGSIRWVADADRLVRASAGRMRWDRLLVDAHRARVSSALDDALGFLASELGTPVPPGVLRRLRRGPRPLVDRLERAMRLGSPAILSDYGKTVAPALRRARERGARRVPGASDAVRAAWRLAVRLPKRHLGRTLRGEAPAHAAPAPSASPAVPASARARAPLSGSAPAG
jgi:hypothetical protein